MVVMNLPNVWSTPARTRVACRTWRLATPWRSWKCSLGMRSRSWWSAGSAGPQPAMPGSPATAPRVSDPPASTLSIPRSEPGYRHNLLSQRGGVWSRRCGGRRAHPQAQAHPRAPARRHAPAHPRAAVRRLAPAHLRAQGQALIPSARSCRLPGHPFGLSGRLRLRSRPDDRICRRRGPRQRPV
jgi:hypothetical protein